MRAANLMLIQGPLVRSFTLYFLGLLYFSATLLYLSLNTEDASSYLTALSACAVALVVSAGVYAAASKFRPVQKERLELGGFEVIWWCAFASALAAIALFLAMVETTALLELYRVLTIDEYQSPYSPLEIRLPTSSMPSWVEGFFEAARRFAFPVLVTLMITGRVKTPVWRMTASIVLGLFFVLSTLDRMIPVMYIAVFWASFVFSFPEKNLSRRWLYISTAAALVGVIVSVTALRPFQYGQITPAASGHNSFIEEQLGLDEAPVENRRVSGSDESETDIFLLINYGLNSLVDRVVLSPIAMAVYSVETYDEDNFQHWGTTRILSMFGFGEFVSPLDEYEGTRYHAAFPLTFIGDLWRQGGFLYIPLYCAVLALLLAWLDRFFFNPPDPDWAPYTFMGVAFLFFGNALSTTTLLLLFGPLICYWFTRLWPLTTARMAALSQNSRES